MSPPVVKRRADAERNRATILATAEAMFATGGLAVSVDDIARRAKVGIGTLYRHFPTKDALVAAIVVDRIARVADRAEALAGERDAGAALASLLTKMVEEGIAKRDFVDALGGVASLDGANLDTTKTRFRKALGKLLVRAQDQNHVRRDLVVGDLTALVRGVLAADNAGTRLRLLAVMLSGLRAE